MTVSGGWNKPGRSPRGISELTQIDRIKLEGGRSHNHTPHLRGYKVGVV